MKSSITLGVGVACLALGLVLAGCEPAEEPPAGGNMAANSAGHSADDGHGHSADDGHGHAPGETHGDAAGNAPAEGNAPATGGEPAATAAPGKVIKGVIKTSMGPIEIELYPDKAPITVKNFVRYANEGHYKGTIFHRVIPGFMIQGGGFTPDMKEKETHEPIKNEAANGLKNERGTLAMARTGVVDSATAQFFINVADNDFLNHQDTTEQGYGYAVFGKVTKGMDVADKIVSVETTSAGPHEGLPTKPVVIEAIEISK